MTAKYIKATITDLEALASIEPETFHRYLTDHGWRQLEIWRGKVIIWETTRHGKQWQLLTLLNPTKGDREGSIVRANQALDTLEQVEERSQLDIYYDLQGSIKKPSGAAG